MRGRRREKGRWREHLLNNYWRKKEGLAKERWVGARKKSTMRETRGNLGTKIKNGKVCSGSKMDDY